MEYGPPHRRTALVVDDDVFLLRAVADLLEEEGYDVHTASNGFSAMRRAVELRPDVILLDLRLPERSGSEVLGELRTSAATRDMAVVVVSGYPDGLSDAQMADLDGLVAKPFDERDLLYTVHRAIQRAATRRAEVAPVGAAAHGAQPARAHRAVSAPRTRRR
jgi:CheY-like chemotaxis protein